NDGRISLQRSRNQENLVQAAVVYAPHYRATQGRASLLERSKPRSVAYNESVVRGGAAGPQPAQKQIEQQRFEPHGLAPLSFPGKRIFPKAGGARFLRGMPFFLAFLDRVF